MTTVRTTSISVSSSQKPKVRSTYVGAKVPATTVRTTAVYALTTNVQVLTTYVAAQYPSNDTPPVANAGNNLFVGAFETFVLDGSASTRADYPISTYAWTVVKSDGSLPDLTFSASTETQSVIAPVLETAGTYTFTLTVTDSHGNQGSDDVSITVDKADVHVALSDNAWHAAGFLTARADLTWK